VKTDATLLSRLLDGHPVAADALTPEVARLGVLVRVLRDGAGLPERRMAEPARTRVRQRVLHRPGAG
jgi:hypothetical protein